ncbi:hypothetical protein Celaphus_00007897, partial [Cervus elaphus hippelaphus]
MEVHGNGKRPSPESPALTVPLMNPGGQFHPTPPPLQHYTLEDIATSHLYREPSKMIEHREVRDRHHNLSLNGGYQDELVDHRLTEREWADEWKHLDHALNCIMEMVEKTRRSMAVLRRCQESDREELNYWKRRFNENTEMRKTGSELVSRQHSPGSADSLSNDSQREFNSRPGTGYVPVEFWKKTEEAVNKVKIQAMSEVQKAVAEAEQKAFEVIATERARMEQTIADVKRQAAEDAFLVINEQEESTENCWNCGRKASETCSGCNIARYCGSFCQHKDWERHHRLCGQNLHGQSPHSQSRPLLPGGRGSSARSADCSVPSPALDKTSATTSRSSTPASNSTREAGYVKQCKLLLGHHPKEKWRQEDFKPQPVHTLVHFPRLKLAWPATLPCRPPAPPCLHPPAAEAWRLIASREGGLSHREQLLLPLNSSLRPFPPSAASSTLLQQGMSWLALLLLTLESSALDGHFLHIDQSELKAPSK